MDNFRPAGLSDEDSDSDDGFYERPKMRYYPPPQSARKKIENTLQDAIINSNINEVEEIVNNELNGSVNIHLDSGWTPLMHACFHAQEKIVKLLLEKGADPNLHAELPALQKKSDVQFEVCTLIGTPVTRQDRVTPVMVACSNSSANNDTIDSIVSYLIEKECLLNNGDKYGQTPLMRAIGSGRVAVVQRLLDMKVNIEMRDQQGWTALFWAVHHNQPEILEMLISQGARVTEVDKSNRKPLEIAKSHDYQNIVEILNKHLNIDENDDGDLNLCFGNQLSTWHDYYPGVTKTEKLDYICEIPHLLYGMNCEKVGAIIQKSGIDLKTFLLLEEDDMIKLGIEMPYQRQRLKTGLRNFHRRTWKLSAVAGLYARTVDNYTVLDCLTALGSHLQQAYILEATLQYSLREYDRIQKQFKFEPPDSPLLNKTKTAANKILTNINNVRKEIKKMKNVLSKISRNNPQPADLIKEKSYQDIAKSYMTEAVIACTIGLLVYQARNYFTNVLTN